MSKERYGLIWSQDLNILLVNAYSAFQHLTIKSDILYGLLHMKNIHASPVGTNGLKHILYKWWYQHFYRCLKSFFSLKYNWYLSQPMRALEVLQTHCRDLKKGVPSAALYANTSFNQIVKGERLHLKDHHKFTVNILSRSYWCFHCLVLLKVTLLFSVTQWDKIQ